MKWKLYISCVFACIVLSVSVIAQTGYESETDLKKQAEQFWEEKDFQGALPLYSQLLSLYPKDPDYNYKFGSCMLHVEEDKSASLKYLEFAASRPNVNPEALFYLGKGYHLNYRFIEAQEKYIDFKEIGAAKEVEKLKVDQHIQMCKSGLNLLSNITDLEVLDKRTLNQSDFFRTYDVSSFGGKIITKPEDFELAADKKVDEPFIMYLDRDADRIYYSSYGDKGKTGKDIYYSKKLPDGTWAEPQSIGSTINTQYDEDYTFFNSKTNTLYFSSTGHNSMGGYDVFKSMYSPSTDTWSKPVNLDYAVNTPDNDFLYITNASEKTAYFATTRSSISGEVTVYKVNVERIPVDFTIIKGEFLSDATKAAKITVEDSNSGEIVGIWNSNSKDGGYLMTLPNGGSFKFTIETEESPMAYFGIVELPKQNVPKPLKQEIALVVENGYEKLIIKNLFDETVESEGTLLTADFLKNRANLQINAEETEEVTEEKIEEHTADSSAEVGGKEFSNDELVKMAYKDAEEFEKEAKESTTQTEIAYAIANQRNSLATEKAKEADIILSEAQVMDNERDKLNALKNGNNLRLESTELAKEAVMAYNLANKLKERSDNLTAQSQQAFEVALQLDNAISSKSQTEIDDAYAKIQGILSTESKGDILAEAIEDYDEKKRASEKQIQKAIKLTEEVTVLDKDISSLLGRVEITKDKEEKALLLVDVAEMEEQLVVLRTEEKQAMDSAKKLQAETDALEEEGELMSDVIKDIKYGDAEELGRLSVEDKQKLAGEITTTESAIVTSEAAAISEQEEIAELKEFVTSGKYEMKEGNAVSESEEVEGIKETEEPLVSIEGETSDSDLDTEEETSELSEEKEEPLVSIEEEVTLLEESESSENNVDEETGSDSENSTEDSFVKKSEIPKENYDSFFETKETELAAISSDSDKASAKVALYKNWLDKTNESIAAKDALIETETDEITRQVYEMEREELEHHKGEQEQQLQEAEASLSETNVLTESGNDSFINEDDIPNENYDFFFEEKLANVELLDNAYKKEEAKSDIYENWVDQMSEELYEKKKELETASKSEKKDIKSRISLLESELEDKRLSKAMADLQVNKIFDEQPELAATDSESIEEGGTAEEEPLISIEGEDTAEGDAEEESASTVRKSKEVTLAELDETQLVSYSLSVTVKKVEKEITDLENELSAIEIKIEEIKNKNEKAELETQKVLIENDLVEKQKEEELLNFKMEVVARVEQEIIENRDIANEEAEFAIAQSEELEFEAIALMDQAKQKRDSADVVKKKQKDEYLAEADRLDREADMKYEESAQKHLIAEEIKNAEVTINELLAEQEVEVLELPAVTRKLTEDDKKAIATSTAYKNYELVVMVARKKYKEADVIYLASDSLKELSGAQSEQAIALREQADVSTNEVFKQELMTQANELDSASVQNAEESKKLVAEAEVIYKEADEKDQEAAQYLATVDQNTYENIVAYEFSVDQDSAIIAKELALAKAVRDAETVNTGTKTESDQIIIEEAFLDDITEVAPTIDIVPTTLTTDIFVQESTPTRSVYTKNKPIPQDTKLPSGIIYKVQVGAFRNPIPQDHFVGFAPIMGESASNGLTRYTAGVFNKFAAVNNAKNQIRNISSDYGDAFVVAYLNGERISISEARRIEREGGTAVETITLNSANTERTIDNAVVATSETATTVSSSIQGDAPVSVNMPIRTNGGNNESGIALAMEVGRISGLFYTTQVGAYSKRVPASQLFNITPLNTDELSNGTIRYSSGVYTDIVTAGAARERILEIGIRDAFITAYYNGVRISVAEARLLVSENGASIYADGTTNGETKSSANTGQETNEVFMKIFLGTYGEGVPMSVAGAILRLSDQGVDEKDNGDGTTTFTIGKFTDSQSAELMLKEVIEDGVASAKVIATKDGAEISLEEAKQLLGE